MYSEANLINYFILELCGIVNQIGSYRRCHDIQYIVSVIVMMNVKCRVSQIPIVMLNVIMLSVAITFWYVECHYADWPYVECHYADWLYADWHYVEC